MVGGHDGHDRLGIVPRDEQCRQANAGGGVAFAGLTNEASLRHLRQLPSYGVEQAACGDHHHAIWRHEAVEPIDRVLEKGLRARQWQELLRQDGAAGGPETGAGSSGHDDRVKHGLSLRAWDSRT